MKSYTISNTWRFVFSLLVFIGGMFAPESVDAQASVTTPCSCGSFTTIGTTGVKTYIKQLGSFNSSTCYFIKGDLVIDTATFWTGLRIKMEEGSRISVIADLSISDCYISGCGDMWQGIHSSGQIDIQTYDSTIEGAEFGIKLKTTAGLVCKTTHFINNYIGITTASPFETDGEDKVIHRGEIEGCHFYTSGTLPDPYPGQFYYPAWPTTPSGVPYNQGFAAIYLSRTVGLDVGSEKATGTKRNKVHDMRNGVILRDRTVSHVGGTDFKDFEGTRVGNEMGLVRDLNQYAIHMNNVVSDIQKDSIKNVMVGIFGFQSANEILKNYISLSTPGSTYGATRGILLRGPQKANIIQNQLFEGMRGISIEDVSIDFRIENNDLTTSYYFEGINIRIYIRNAKLDPTQGHIVDNDLVIDDAMSSTGIHAINTNRLWIEDNDIQFFNDEEHQTRGILGVGTYRSQVTGNTVSRDGEEVLEGNNGIQLENSGFNTVFCNSMDNFYINLNMRGPDIHTNIVSNEMNEGEYGFAIWSPTLLGVQKDHGNLWPTAYYSYGAYLFGDDPEDEAKLSRFIVDELEDSDFMPDPIGPEEIEDGLWFRNVSTPMQGTYTCFNNPPPIANPDTLSNLIRTELSYSQFNDEMTWIVKADVFDMILADPGLTSNAVLDSFYDAEDDTALGKLIAWQNDLASRFGEERTLKELTLDTIATLSGDIVYIDSILALHPSDSATWIALRALKGDTLKLEVTELKVYLDDEESDSKDAYAAIEDDLDNLSTTNDLEAYLKEALLFKTQYLLGTSYNATDSADLEILALLCPWEGGRAMATGQEMYSTIKNQMVLTSLENCPPSSRPGLLNSVSQENDNEMIMVRPNPVGDIAEVSCNDVIQDLRIWDSQMHMVQESKPMLHTTRLDLTDIPAGTYILSITTPQGQYFKRIIHVK